MPDKEPSSAAARHLLPEEEGRNGEMHHNMVKYIVTWLDQEQVSNTTF